MSLFLLCQKDHMAIVIIKYSVVQTGAPVWTTLYLMMTIAIWSFWHSKKRDIDTIYIYIVHLIFNTTWSIVFFVFHKILLALLILIILIALIVLLMH